MSQLCLHQLLVQPKAGPLWVGFCPLAAGLLARPTRNAPLMKSERFLCHATGRWVQGSARLEKVERNQSSDVHNTLVVNSSRPPALGVWLCVPLPACPRKNQQLGPQRVNTKQVRNKKHHANPPLQKIELQTCVAIHISTLKTISGQHTFFGRNRRCTNQRCKVV